MQKILMIGENQEDTEFLKVILDEDYESKVVCTAKEGLACAVTGEYSLIFIDTALPEMEEFVFLKELQEKIISWHIPVILLIDEADVRKGERGLALGAADYIVRPLYPMVVKSRARAYVSLYQYRKNAKEQAVLVDSLTGVASRQQYETECARKWQEAVRLNVPISVCVFDVDKFKTYNERYGYPAGDKVLISVAETISSCLKRGTDLFARYDGDLFAAVILGGKGEDVYRHQKTICRMVEKLHIPHWDSASGWVTVSIGGVTVVPQLQDSCDEFFAMAQNILSDAKNAGRNQAIWTDEKMKKLTERDF
ncbi:MAG: diguanylate cyclase [Coprococcus sp.]|nr:diguanylate cyclase [Coprococcus sp.]